jgi:hypothetical protein
MNPYQSPETHPPLTDLEIRGYKLFDELKLSGLGRFNLFFGQNNTGKTCLLEALRLYSSFASPSVIRDLLNARDAQWAESKSDDQDWESPNLKSESYIRFLFKDFHYDPHVASEIIVSGGKGRELSIKFAYFRREPAQEDSIAPTRWFELDGEGDYLDEFVRPMLSVSFAGRRITLTAIDRFFRRPLNLRPALTEEVMPVMFIPASGLRDEELASLWENVIITPEVDLLLDCMKIIDPRIAQVGLVSGTPSRTGRARVPLVRLDGIEERLPMRAMGDGVTRLFQIALGMLNARGGLLLVDEMENGLHWSVQERFWPALLEIASKLDVQIFATTHSTDCINGFVRASQSRLLNESRLYRLQRVFEHVEAVFLPFENVKDALEMKVELR